MFDSTHDLSVRPAVGEDLPAIAEFAVQLARQHADYDNQRFDLNIFEPLEDSHLDFIADQFQNQRASIIVAEMDGRIVGYAFLRLEPKHLGDLSDEGVWLHDIYFDETARGLGIAGTLFARVVEEAKKLGSDYLMLTVSPKNTRAQRFFRKMGLRLTMHEMRLDFSSNEKGNCESQTR